MSKKHKMIISVIAAVLVLATVLGIVAAVIGRQHDIKRAQEEYEHAQNASHKYETTDNMEDSSASDVPPVIVPDDSNSESGKGDLILDVSDKDRNPNPEVIDVIIEYGTKEVEQP